MIYVNALDEVIPVNHIFRYVVHRVFEIEPIPLAIQRRVVALLKPYRIHAIPKGEV